jgi:hypothetical protein
MKENLTGQTLLARLRQPWNQELQEVYFQNTECVSESGDFATLFFSGSATLGRTYVFNVLNCYMR